MVWFGWVWFGLPTSLSGVRELFPLLSKRFDTSAGLVMHKSIQTEYFSGRAGTIFELSYNLKRQRKEHIQ